MFPLPLFTLPLFRRLLVCGALILASLVRAQNAVDLETAVPANWTATGGALSMSPLHYKAGVQSLRWDWSGGSVLTVANPGISAADVTDFYKNTCDFWVWNGAAVPGGKLRVEFLNGATAQYWFDFHLDYTGWRRAVRSYTNDMSKKSSPSAAFTSVRITVQATGAGSLFLDDVTWVGDRFTRIRDAQNPDIQGSSSATTFATAYALALDPATPPTPTATEITELNTLRSRWLTATKGASAPSSSSVTTAGNSFATLGIVEDANGIRGQPFGHLNPSLESWPLTLARDYAWGTSATKNASRDKVLQLLRHLMDQGHVANSNVVPTHPAGPDGYNYRGLPNALVLMAPAYDAATKAKLWEFFRWAFNLGDFWTDSWERNTDEIYLQSLQELGAILFLTPSDAEAVRQLKGYQRYMNRFWQFSEGGEDGVKVDGLGFHHRSHYNNYMYAYGPAANALYHLRGTGFQIDQPAYETLRLAFLAQMRMSADGTGTAGNTVGYFGNALCGRKPFDTDITFSQAALQQLGELGGGFYGQSADPVVARAYNRRYGTGSYALFAPYGAEPSPDGFLQFNYSPLGIYRRANWVASIRAPQRFFWSSEIYPDANRYGRYQSYGALEILYSGGRTMSGQQLNGWDWNAIPGTTTIVLPDAKLVAENGREDVRSQLNFSGALAFQDGQSGLYAANFQESNAGANHNPSFVWRKSWFAFDSQIVCLGSDIANNDAANPTATTLLQGALAAPSTALTLNGAAITAFPHSSTVSGATANWLLDPFGTGYLVQPGANLKITRSTQTSANEDGVSAPTTGNFAKVWLDHGTAPTGASYEYAVFPAATPTAMASAAVAHANPATKPYQVIQHNSTAHVVKWHAGGQLGYAIYTTTALPAATQNAGLLLSVQRPCLVMTQLGANLDATLSVVDPDLNFTETQAAYGKPDASRARTLDLTLRGSWTLDNPEAGTSIVASTATTTTLRVTTQHGFAEHVRLLSATPADLAVWANLGSAWTDPLNWGDAWGGAAPANDLITHRADLGAATVQPILDTAASVKGLQLAGNTTLSGSGTLAIGASGIVTTGNANALALAGLSLGANQTWDIGTGALTVSAPLGGSSADRLSKTGAGTLTLSAANTYAGGLTVTQGVVNLLGDQSAATGGIAQNLTNTSASTLNLGSASQTTPTTLSVTSASGIQAGNSGSGGTLGTGAQTLSVVGASGNPTTVSNLGPLLIGRNANATLGANARWTQAGPLTLRGVGGYHAVLTLANATAFTYAGPSDIALNPDPANTSSARLLIGSGGVFTTARGFVFGGSTSTGTGQITLSGGGKIALAATVPTLVTGATSGSFRLGAGGGVIDTAGFDTTLSHPVTDDPGVAGTLQKIGAGTLTLTEANTFTGGLTLGYIDGQAGLGGILRATASTALGTGAVTILGGDPTNTGRGAQLQLAGDLTLAPPSLALSGYGFAANDGVLLSVSGTNTVAAPILLTAGTGGAVIGASSGSTLIVTGGVSADTPGRSLEFTGAGDIRVEGLIANGLTSALPLRKTGPGTLTLAAAHTYTGPTTLQEGVVSTALLAVNGSASGLGAGSGSAGLVFDGGTLRYTGPAISTSPGWNRGYTLGPGGAHFDLGAAAGQLWISGAIAFSGSGPRTVAVTTGQTAGGRFGSALADGPGGASSLVKQGAGTLLVTGANTYTGPLQILAGTVQYGNAGPGGESSGAGHSVVVGAGATLSFRHANTAVTYNAPISGAGAVLMNYNNTSAGGSLTLGGNNSFSGGLTVNPSSGANVFPLRAGSAAAFGSGNVTLGQYGTLDLNGFDNTTGLLASAGTNGRVTNHGAADATLTLGGAGTPTYGGVIQDGAKKLSLTKTGAGTQILSGALTYTGDTSVSAGGFELAASGSLGFRPLANDVCNRVTVASGASSVFRGSFVIDLSGATATAGNTWTLVAAAASTATYAATFQVPGFTKSTPAGGTVWTKIDGTRTWTFTETTGVLRLQISGYATWIAGFSALSDTAPGADSDGDGVVNLMEYVLFGDPLTSDAAAILPAASPSPDGIRFTFRRSDASESDTVTTFQYTRDLGAAAVWNDLVIGAVSGGPDAAGVVYAVEENAAGADLITVTVPLGPTGRVFGRVRVVSGP
jgi:chondroitin-sulfate-ABC endolyase/exolyase